MRKAFSLLELFMSIALAGVMLFSLFIFLNTKSITKSNIKLELQSQLSIITETILQCKEYSNMMPIQDDGADANNTALNTLECNTSTPYKLDGGKNSFIPRAVDGFSDYNATKDGSEFYFSTTTSTNSYNDEVLQELNSTYSTNQYELTRDSSTVQLKFYLSR